VAPGPKKKQVFPRRRFTRKKPAQAQVAGAAAPAAGKTVAGNAAAGTAAAGTAVKTKTKTVASNKQQNVLKPGKKEKIRFGQAPRESLPPAQNDVSASPGAQTASVTNPEVQAINPDGTLAGQTAAPVKEKKTRFSDRPVVHKTKEQKEAEALANSPSPASADELATQKVQNAPLGLADQNAAKKKKVKGPKTRYSDKPKQPEETPQPYQQPNTSSQPPAGSQPAPNAPAATPPQ
jgi:peptidyl-prolyl cis-trans isomerase SurA